MKNQAAIQITAIDMKKITLQDERLRFLRVLYEVAIESEYGHVGISFGGMRSDELKDRTSINGQKFQAIWSCLHELEYIKQYEHVMYITAKGMIYYEDLVSEIERREHERKMVWLKMLLPAIAASMLTALLTLAIQDFTRATPQSLPQPHEARASSIKSSPKNPGSIPQNQAQSTRRDSGSNSESP